MFPSATCNLSSLPLSHDWIGCFSCKDAVMMIAVVKKGIELLQMRSLVILFSENLNLFVFW